MRRAATPLAILVASAALVMGCAPQKTSYSAIGEGQAPALSIDVQGAADFEAPTSIAASIRKTRIAYEQGKTVAAGHPAS